MPKQQEQQTEKKHQLSDFIEHINLFNIVPGGDGKAITLLKTIVDSIQATNYKYPNKQLPSFLLIGGTNTGKSIVAQALANSLACSETWLLPAEYLDAGAPSVQFFSDSYQDTCQILTGFLSATKLAESVVYRYLKDGKCNYYNYITKKCDIVNKAFGMLILTADSQTGISKSVLKEIDHVVELQPYTTDQIIAILHQYLNIFLKIQYEDAQVLKEIVEIGQNNVRHVVEFLRLCLVVMDSEMKECITMKTVNKAKRLWQQAPIRAPPRDGSK
jgi:hypothetical protein